MNLESRAMRHLSTRPVMYQLITSYCVKLIALQMVADSIRGAVVYFSAASRMKYGYMVVVDKDENIFNIYETTIARKNFDTNTEIIEPCCGIRNHCDTYLRMWFFCAENRRTDFPDAFLDAFF